MRENIEQTIMEYMTEEFLQDKDWVDLTEDTQLIDDNVLDSLGIFVVISFLETEFEVEVEPDEVTVDNFGSVRAIGNFVREKQKAASST